MSLSIDISQPQSNQTVGLTFTVIGSFDGSDGNPFNITCNVGSFSQPAQIDIEEGTWQSTFTVPSGMYEISATGAAATGVVASTKPRPLANPVLNVQVSSNTPVSITAPTIDKSSMAIELDGETELPIQGTCQPGFGLKDGYVVCVYLRLGGKQVSARGRLISVTPDSAGGTSWQYPLGARPSVLLAATAVVVELWNVNPNPPTEPVITIATLLGVTDRKLSPSLA